MTIAPRTGPLSLDIQADPQEFRRASAWLHGGAAALGMPQAQIDRLDLCLNEVLANLTEHGGQAVANHPILLRLESSSPAGGCVDLLVSDRGQPFDSGKASIKNLPGSLEGATPGGLGLRLVKAFCDGLDYRVLDGRNELRITMRWSSRS